MLPQAVSSPRALLLLFAALLCALQAVHAQQVPFELEDAAAWRVVESHGPELGWAIFAPAEPTPGVGVLTVYYDREGAPSTWRVQMDSLTYMRVPAYGLASVRGTPEAAHAYWEESCRGQGGLVMFADADGKMTVATVTDCSRPGGEEGEYAEDHDGNDRPDLIDAIDLLNVIAGAAYARFP